MVKIPLDTHGPIPSLSGMVADASSKWRGEDSEYPPTVTPKYERQD